MTDTFKNTYVSSTKVQKYNTIVVASRNVKIHENFDEFYADLLIS